LGFRSGTDAKRLKINVLIVIDVILDVVFQHLPPAAPGAATTAPATSVALDFALVVVIVGLALRREDRELLVAAEGEVNDAHGALGVVLQAWGFVGHRFALVGYQDDAAVL
jgi:hypothetical protein